MGFGGTICFAGDGTFELNQSVFCPQITPPVKKQKVSIEEVEKLFATFTIHGEGPQNNQIATIQQLQSALSSVENSKIKEKKGAVKVEEETGKITDKQVEAEDRESRQKRDKGEKRPAKGLPKDKSLNENTSVKKFKGDDEEGRNERFTREKEDGNDGQQISENEEKKTQKHKRGCDKEEERGVKKQRRLKRGLALCSSITCYIEQVLYNC